MSESRVQFTGTIDPDGAADEFILGYLARHRGGPVTATKVWKSVHSRGLTPSLGRQSGPNDANDEAAVAEILRRLEKWADEGLVGGDKVPESVTQERHFWALGQPKP